MATEADAKEIVVSTDALQHFVIMTDPIAPHPEMEGANQRHGAVVAGKVTAGGQRWACGLDNSKLAGRFFEGAMHLGTDHVPLVNCPWCKVSQEFKDEQAKHDSYAARDRGIFHNAGAMRPGGAPRPVAGTTPLVVQSAVAASQPVLPANQSAPGPAQSDAG